MINGFDQNWTRLKRHLYYKLLYLMKSFVIRRVGSLQFLPKLYI